MQPPFVMDKWGTGLQENQRVDYTVNYEVGHFSSCSLKMHHTGSHAQSCLTTYISLLSLQNDVKSPKSTRHSCSMTWSVNGGRDEIKTVELVIETAPASTDWNLKDRSNRGKYLLFIHIVFLAEKKNSSYRRCI